MHRSLRTLLVYSPATVSLLTVMVLMFIGIPAVHAQDADTTSVAQDSTVIVEDEMLDDGAAETEEDAVFEMTDVDSTQIDASEADSLQTEEFDFDMSESEADTTIIDEMMTDQDSTAAVDEMMTAPEDSTSFTEDMMMGSDSTETVDEMMMDTETSAEDSLMTEEDSFEIMVEDTAATYDPFAMQPDPYSTTPEGMVWISAGKLPDPLRKFRDEEVEVAWTNGFYIDKTEVTNNDFANFLSSDFDNAVFFDERMYITEVSDGVFVADTGRENLPVTFVNWFGAFAYSQWAGKSLPTEEEWILACMGSYEDQDLTKWYPWGQVDPTTVQANLLDVNLIGSPQEVMSYPSSMTPTGVYDMAGNVAEWTLTNFTIAKPASSTDDSGEYENPTLASQEITETDSTTVDQETTVAMDESLDVSLRFVIKGGSYLDPVSNMQLNRRATRFPFERYQYVGFRCVRREGNR